VSIVRHDVEPGSSPQKLSQPIRQRFRREFDYLLQSMPLRHSSPLTVVNVSGAHWMQSHCSHYLTFCAPQNPNQVEHGSESDGKEDDSSVVVWFARQKAEIK
jgi:hypothetical protein